MNMISVELHYTYLINTVLMPEEFSKQGLM